MITSNEATKQFELWLPGELVYSATKAGYDKKIQRAHLPIEDPASIYGFLGSEWFTHQQMKQAGNHHADQHQKTAQLQLAKFAAGLFDKAALGLWLASGKVADTASFVGSAKDAAALVSQTEPWEAVVRPLDFIDAPFEETPFAEGIAGIMKDIVSVGSAIGTERKRVCTDIIYSSLALGGVATKCYQSYAESYLQPEELLLPASELG
jgi:hypothetical protein